MDVSIYGGSPDYEQMPEEASPSPDDAPPTPDDILLATLQDIAERIIPENRQDELRALVEAGKIDPVKVFEPQPLLSPVTLMFRTDDPAAWLKILFSKEPGKIVEAKCPCYNFSDGYFSVDPNFTHPRRYSPYLETPSLLTVLAAQTPSPVVAIAGIDASLLGADLPGASGTPAGQPLLHRLLASNVSWIQTLDKLETLAGNTDFLFLRNARGETLFHCVASNPDWREDQLRLDAASWMLQRRPELVNTTDRFGWTPLDRQLSRAGGKNYDNSMCRLLLASGARLEKQIAPEFNLRAELDERSGARLEKPAAPKAVLRKNTL